MTQCNVRCCLLWQNSRELSPTFQLICTVLIEHLWLIVLILTANNSAVLIRALFNLVSVAAGCCFRQALINLPCATWPAPNSRKTKLVTFWKIRIFPVESGETKSKRKEKEYWNSQVDRDALVQMSDDMFSVCLCKHVKAVLHACSSAPKWSKHLITYSTMKIK